MGELEITARRDTDDTHWPQVVWTGLQTAMLTCTCGAVDTEPVALGHLIAFQAAEEKLLMRHGCAIFSTGGENELDPDFT